LRRESIVKIDFIDTLHALEHFDIRVVRAKYVDSAQDAIAFAARQEMRDPHAVPIVMSLAGRDEAVSTAGAFPDVPLAGENVIRDAFDSLTSAAQATGKRILAREYIAAATDVAIVGRTEDGRKYLSLCRADHGLKRLLPLTEVGAELMAGHFLAHDHRGSEKRRRRMLEHLTLRASKLFESPEIDSLDLDPIRLHENTYTVLSASIEAASPLHIVERLERHAHDHKGFGYRNAG
jgi:hypothetical protein